ncbi:sensor histidine kinase [Sulfuricystis multivorans]|uniref:sensor histidine kinase n=1 Tax=Sulfuricystis multivorans TaxID=2211108 RepID=UPI000F830F27|nr:histidine kinase [Sulfuricystis multivorans]
MSIPSSPIASVVPDFSNQGIWLRLLLAGNGLLLLLALARNRDLARLGDELLELSALAEPALLTTLAGLFPLASWLRRQPLPWAFAVVVGWAAAAFAGIDFLLATAFGGAPGWRAPLAGGLGAMLLLAGFKLRAQAQTPALAEARLAALNARIRPHFLFNSLNAILGVMRDDPRRAETALEELAELFRVLLRDNRALVPLSEEIALARKYLALEKLRLGERLKVRWEMDDYPPELLAPPLLLQPLLENAVYHGVEMVTEPGEIVVRIRASRDGVHIEIDNPLAASSAQRPGNRMALDNLRERLMLFYDLEARLETGEHDGRYRVRVELPRRESA